MEVNFKTTIKKSVNIDFQKIFDFIADEMCGYNKPIDIANRFAYNTEYYVEKTQDLGMLFSDYNINDFSICGNDENNDILEDISCEFYNWVEKNYSM